MPECRKQLPRKAARQKYYALAESLITTLKADDIYPYGYETFSGVADAVAHIEDVHSAKRLHSAALRAKFETYFSSNRVI